MSFTISRSLLKLMFIESVMPSNHPILCHSLLLLLSIFPSIRFFSNELALRIRWPKYWSFSFSISPSNEYSGLISFRIDWFDLLAVQGTLKSLLRHHSLKVSILWCSAFFIDCPTLTSIHDYWENHSFDYTALLAKGSLCILICYLSLLSSESLLVFYPVQTEDNSTTLRVTKRIDNAQSALSMNLILTIWEQR